MERHRCKLCTRTFPSGRALGGHMKGHLASLPLPSKSTQQPKNTFSCSSSSSQEHEEDKILAYGLRENPKKSYKLADPEFSIVLNSESPIVHDGESETESRNSTKRISKRNQEHVVMDNMKQPKMKKQSLVELSAEDVAMCLIMLSRDEWTTKRQNHAEQKQEKSDEMKFECEKCNKVFKSSRALAGHKASHKNLRDEVDALGNVKVFECPFCFEVFGSGQALGGHKRSHMGSGSCASSVDLEVKLIDLNMPAPDEDDELSVVSDAEFVDPIKK